MTIEVTEQTTEAAPSTQPDAYPSREELIAAVREAGGADSVDVEAEAAAAAARTGEAPAPAPAAAGEPAPDPDEPRIAGILRAREKAAQERAAARSAADDMLAQARQESQRMIQDARAEAAREAAAEKERLRAEFRANPTATLRALGDPREISDAVMREGTPEAREMASLRAELEATKKQAGEVTDVRKQLDEFREGQRQEALQRQIAEVKSTFLSQATTEKAPYLNARYEPEEIFARADNLAKKWRSGGLELGKDFDHNDLVQYLEVESKKRISPLGLATPAQQVSAGAPAKEPGNAPKVPANGPRTLSAAQGSERRTSPKPIREMTAQEARDALIEEVAAARRANPDATF